MKDHVYIAVVGDGACLAALLVLPLLASARSAHGKASMQNKWASPR